MKIVPDERRHTLKRLTEVTSTFHRLGLLIAVTVVLCGCGAAADPTPIAQLTRVSNPTPQPSGFDATPLPVDGPTLLANALRTMANLKSYHFEQAESEDSAAMRGDFVFPDRQRVELASGEMQGSELIKIGDDVYMKTPAEAAYVPLPGANPIGGFVPLPTADAVETYISEIEDIVVQGKDEINGSNTTLIRYLAPSISEDLPDEFDRIHLDVWIQDDTHYILKVASAGDDPAPTMFSRFNEPVEPPIERPQ